MFKSFHKDCRLVLLVAIFVGTMAASAAAQSGRVTEVFLKADHATYDGPCPVTVHFSGYIKADGPTDVRYIFTRSDGATMKPLLLSFGQAGMQRVETTWTLGDARLLPRYEGWEAIKVLSPNLLESSHTTGRFTLRCSGAITAGRPIIFTSERDGNYEIYSMNPDGSSQTNLTRNPANDLYPRLSPDGTRIVFESNRDGNNEIYVMNVDGSGQTRLTNDPAYDHAPTWSPDGRRIVFSRGSGALSADTELYVMNVDGSALTRLTTNSVYDTDPSWSPDSRSIAFSSGDAGASHIYLMDVSTSATRQLTADPGRDIEPDWSPDGRRIVFTRMTDRDHDIWVMNADGSGQTNITRDSTSFDDDAAWSSDGRRIVFVKNPAGGGLNIYLMNADGSGLSQITVSDHEVHPDW